MKKANKKVAKTTVKAKGKKAEAAESLPVKAPRKLDISRDRVEIGTGQLKPAPWNPRGEISAESVADLVASIATVGIIEPLVVMESESGKDYIIIAGHRRAKAAALAECKTVPCDVLRGIDVATAKRMTFIENLQRRDADPILESNLVAELVADGMTTDEIAAEIGRDRKWVLRRKNLSNLSPSWRKRIEKGEKITTDCLEHIAAFPKDVQERLKKDGTYHHSALRWCDIERYFNSESKSLDGALFDTTPCKSCANNAGCTPDLFDWTGKPATLGKCLCERCYEKKLAAHIDDTIKQAKSDGRQVINRQPGYYTKVSPTRTKTCSVLYVYKKYNDETVIEWGAPPPKEKDSAKESVKEREKHLAEKRKKREHNKAIRALMNWCATDDNLAKLIADYFKDPLTGEILPHAPFYVAAAFSGLDSYNLLCSGTDKRKGGIAAIFGNLRIPVGWANVIAGQIISYLDPGRSQGYYADSNANLILAMFPSVREAIGKDVAEKIISTAAADKLKCPEIKWHAGVRSNGQANAEPSDANTDPLGDDEALPGDAE